MKRDTGLRRDIRDGVLLATGTFMLLFMTATGHVYPLLVGAALTVLGIPTGVRAAEIYRAAKLPGSSSSVESADSPGSPQSSSHTRLEGDTDDQRRTKA